MSLFVGEGNGRQMTTLFFARATAEDRRKTWMLEDWTELVEQNWILTSAGNHT